MNSKGLHRFDIPKYGFAAKAHVRGKPKSPLDVKTTTRFAPRTLGAMRRPWTSASQTYNSLVTVNVRIHCQS